MAVRVDWSRSIENAECSIGAVEGIELGQDPTGPRLDPGVSQIALILGAKGEGDAEQEQSAHIVWSSQEKITLFYPT
jgi:hypothetical protein